MGTQVKPLDCAWAQKHRYKLSHYFIACRCYLGLRIQFTPASKETGGIFEKIMAGVTGLEPESSCQRDRRSNRLRCLLLAVFQFTDSLLDDARLGFLQHHMVAD